MASFCARVLTIGMPYFSATWVIGSDSPDVAGPATMITFSWVIRRSASLAALIGLDWLSPNISSILAPCMLLMPPAALIRSEEHTSELQSLMRISYAVFCLKKKKNETQH